MFEAAELDHQVAKADYKREEAELRRALLEAQRNLGKQGRFPVLILIAGVEGAGKSETVHLLNEWMDARHIDTLAFGEPGPKEQGKPFLWRYWQYMPAKGRSAIVFGSWYRPLFQELAEKDPDPEKIYDIAHTIRDFERTLADNGVQVLKLWYHLSKDAQEKRTEKLLKDPDTAWQVNPDDLKVSNKFGKAREAGLLAMSQEAVKKPVKRTQIFLWVAAEEQGLLGSAAYAADPLWPLNKTAAALNLDSLNFVGATHDIGAQGSERTELGAMAATVAKSMDMHIAQARPDLAGGYFRSDHFSFAKAGVPAFSINGGREYIKDVAESKAKAAAYGPRYHQVTDEYDASWDLSGMTQQAQFTLNLGQAVANAAKMPAWKAGDAFGKARAQAK